MGYVLNAPVHLLITESDRLRDRRTYTARKMLIDRDRVRDKQTELDTYIIYGE